MDRLLRLVQRGQSRPVTFRSAIQRSLCAFHFYGHLSVQIRTEYLVALSCRGLNSKGTKTRVRALAVIATARRWLDLTGKVYDFLLVFCNDLKSSWNLEDLPGSTPGGHDAAASSHSTTTTPTPTSSRGSSPTRSTRANFFIPAAS